MWSDLYAQRNERSDVQVQVLQKSSRAILLSSRFVSPILPAETPLVPISRESFAVDGRSDQEILEECENWQYWLGTTRERSCVITFRRKNFPSVSPTGLKIWELPLHRSIFPLLEVMWTKSVDPAAVLHICINFSRKCSLLILTIHSISETMREVYYAHSTSRLNRSTIDELTNL